MSERWQRMRQTVRAEGRPLTCPLCQFHFESRHFVRSSGACPSCKVPLGIPFYYRAILVAVSLCVMAYVEYKGNSVFGPDWGILLALPFAAIAGIYVQWVIYRAFPPKLEPYAIGGTWLKLTK